MGDWHIQIGQQQYGPIPEETLRDWIGQGRVGPNDYVWTATMPNWAPAGTVFAFQPGATPPIAGVPVWPNPQAGVTYAYYKPHRGTMILVFGILGICVCVIFGIVALVMGNSDMREIKAVTMDPSGESLTNAGRLMGIISVILACVGIVLWLLYVVVMAVGFGVMAHR